MQTLFWRDVRACMLGINQGKIDWLTLKQDFVETINRQVHVQGTAILNSTDYVL
jgi:hypothetical protein